MKTSIGSIFGFWAVIERGKPNHVLCRCRCGVEKWVHISNLTSGKTLSCGCDKHRKASENLTKHGMFGTPTYSTWSSMMTRCFNKNSKSFNNYGGRGVSVCDRWKKFEHFLEDMGEKPNKGISIERINNNGNYEPGNCVWATAKEQNRNRRNTKLSEQLVVDLRSGVIDKKKVIDSTGCAKSTVNMAIRGANWKS